MARSSRASARFGIGSTLTTNQIYVAGGVNGYRDVIPAFCRQLGAGFQIPNDYVVGYGLDYRELYRNLPFICTLRASVFELPQPVPPPA